MKTMKIKFAQSFARDRIHAYMANREYDVDDREARELITKGIATECIISTRFDESKRLKAPEVGVDLSQLNDASAVVTEVLKTRKKNGRMDPINSK